MSHQCPFCEEPFSSWSPFQDHVEECDVQRPTEYILANKRKHSSHGSVIDKGRVHIKREIPTEGDQVKDVSETSDDSEQAADKHQTEDDLSEDDCSEEYLPDDNDLLEGEFSETLSGDDSPGEESQSEGDLNESVSDTLSEGESNENEASESISSKKAAEEISTTYQSRKPIYRSQHQHDMFNASWLTEDWSLKQDKAKVKRSTKDGKATNQEQQEDLSESKYAAHLGDSASGDQNKDYQELQTKEKEEDEESSPEMSSPKGRIERLQRRRTNTDQQESSSGSDSAGPRSVNANMDSPAIGKLSFKRKPSDLEESAKLKRQKLNVDRQSYERQDKVSADKQINESASVRTLRNMPMKPLKNKLEDPSHIRNRRRSERITLKGTQRQKEVQHSEFTGKLVKTAIVSKAINEDQGHSESGHKNAAGSPMENSAIAKVIGAEKKPRGEKYNSKHRAKQDIESLLTRTAGTHKGSSTTQQQAATCKPINTIIHNSLINMSDDHQRSTAQNTENLKFKSRRLSINQQQEEIQDDKVMKPPNLEPSKASLPVQDKYDIIKSGVRLKKSSGTTPKANPETEPEGHLATKEKKATLPSGKPSSGKQFKCKLCRIVLASREEIGAHFQLFHAEHKPFRCQVCSFRGSSSLEVSEHMSRHHTGTKRGFRCEPCNKTFREMAHLRSHLNQSKVHKQKI